MYLVLLDWCNYTAESIREEVYPWWSANTALDFVNYICRTTEGYNKYDKPKNVYLYKIDDPDDFKEMDEKIDCLSQDKGWIASWMDIDTWFRTDD